MHDPYRIRAICALLMTITLLASPAACLAAEDDEPIDRQRVNQLRQKQRNGEELTDAEKAYLQKAMEARRGRGGRARGGRGPADGAEHQDDRNAQTGRQTTGLTPLTDLEGKYKGFDGGLYGGGRNAPDEEHMAVAMKAAGRIRPLDADGKADPKGKIALVGIGMSNTWREFKGFKEIADKDPAKSPRVVIIQAAQPGMDVQWWSDESKINNFKFTPDGIESGKPVWSYVDKQLAASGATAKQVQALWIKQARIMPQREGAFPKHNQRLQRYLTKIIQIGKRRYPNLQIAYLSSRIYAGYSRRGLSPEPYAYENAFGIRQLILDQMKGDPQLNFDPAKGEVKAPLALWGPYLWADGKTPRKTDGLVWLPEDFDADLTHPSFKVGVPKVAGLLLKFLKTDPTARPWFVKGAVK